MSVRGKSPSWNWLPPGRVRILTANGQMGAPSCMVWNFFAARSPEEAEKRLKEGMAAVEQKCLSTSSSEAGWIKDFLALI